MAFSEQRSPEVVVLANGAVLPGIIEVEIDSNSYLAANRFRLRASLTATGYDVWGGSPLTVEIQVGLDGSWSSLITGDIDELDFDLGRGEVQASGRDLTSRFIEARTQESFENQTASAVAGLLAARRGLVPVVTPTSRVIGRNFQNTHSSVTLDQYSSATTEWDLLVRLAEGEGFDVWVSGQSLYFAPPDETANGIQLAPADCQSLHLQRLPPLSGGLEVTVKSWDCRGQMAVAQTANAPDGAGATSRYVIVKPNLTQDSALRVAQRVLTQMLQQARSVAIEMPGDLTTRPRDILTLVGTGTDFDGCWAITTIERHISFARGFTQRLEARVPAWIAF